ncbi:hypothetical protein ACWCYL_23155 [Streptomyces sp. 900105755]
MTRAETRQAPRRRHGGGEGTFTVIVAAVGDPGVALAAFPAIGRVYPDPAPGPAAQPAA